MDYAKVFDCVDHNKLWGILIEVRIPDHLTCLLRSLYTGQEATVRTGHVTTDWFHIGKGVPQGCILSLCLLNLHADCIMRNARLKEAPAGISINWEKYQLLQICHTLMAESEGVKSLLMKVKEWKIRLKIQHSENEDHDIQSHHFMANNRWGNNGNSKRLYFLWPQNHCRWWLQSWN